MSSGMVMTSRRLDANEMRAGVSRRRTSVALPTSKSSPVSVTRPRPTAREGMTDVTVGGTCVSVISGFVELHIPVQIVAPALRRVAQADRDADRRRRIGAPRVARQPHACLSRRAATLLPVARHAAGDDVLPVLAAALGDRNDVVERQLGGRVRLSAVLAGVVVTRVDVRARERNVVEAAFDFDEAKQTDNGRQLEAEGHCPYLAVVNRDHLYFPLAPERDRLLPVDNLERLVRRVEKERLLHSLSSHDAGRLPGCQESARPNA